MSKKTNAMRLLEAAGIPYTLTTYQYDAEELSVAKIAAENKLTLERIFKTLVLKTDTGSVVVAVTPGDKQLDIKAISKESNCKKVALAASQQLQALTGYIRGGCSPIGMKKNYPVIVDISALSFERIYVNAGMRGLLMELSPQDLQRACGGIFAKIV